VGDQDPREDREEEEHEEGPEMTNVMNQVDVSIRIEAEPAVVFEFFTDPEKMIRWKGIAAKLDPRPGGIYHVDVGGNAAVGEFLEVVPPERVVFTWGWEGNDGLPPGSTRVEITLTPDGDGTVVRLVHTDLPTEQSARQHGQGWTHYLERLRIAAPGGDPGDVPLVIEE
jgi:uncharacterized protein YndB with AHSA1/START domain